MAIILSESHIRSVVAEAFKISNQRGSSSFSSTASATNPISDYEGEMVTISNGKKYLGDPATGLSPKGFWKKLRDDLQAYMAKNYPELGLTTKNLGVTRDLAASLNPSSSARAKGSKHGAGLATDVYLNVKGHPFTAYKVDNPRLAEDKKLVILMRSFTATQPGVVWGGDFDGGTGDAVVGRGITEFHHFEIEDARMPSYFKQFNDEIEALDGNLSASNINSLDDLALLYSKIA